MVQPTPKNEISLEIDGLVYGPGGIGRHEGRAVIVSGAAPGDRVVARIRDMHRRYATAELLQVLRPSPERQAPPCPYFAQCGGCPWQHVRYRAQLDAKQKCVEEALRRIGKLTAFEVRPILASPREYHYRRRVRLALADDGRIGFRRARSRALVEIDSCLIAAEPVNGVLEALRAWARDIRTEAEELEVVAGDGPDELVAVLRRSAPFHRPDAAAEALLRREPRLRGLVATGGGTRRAWGETRVSLAPEPGVDLRVEADVFTQVNPEGNRVLVRELLDAAEPGPADRVLELYSGAGNFTLPIARRAGEVVAVEGSRVAMESARHNAQRGGLANIRWMEARVPDAVESLSRRGERFAKIVLDPPRAGAKEIQESIASLGAARIVYVSCDPATLARDLAALARRGYRLERVQPIDLFPHTFHVEAVALLAR
ncbi:MAG TPA: 23S rRNA (uracil(1939)-C(5))-methyltransferase RlmD [candidate division Zixibacteria bacterium]|nr:23S rRNA (uracil(1939)-C(5))-methyltransferase RlmD [candidate division Zixibacteria bacterium]